MKLKYCKNLGDNKARVGALAIGGSLTAVNRTHAQCLYTAGRLMGMKLSVKAGKNEYTITRRA